MSSFACPQNRDVDQFRKPFLPILKADKDKAVSLIVEDKLGGDSLHLDRLTDLDESQIPEPEPFQRQNGAAPIVPVPSTRPFVPENVVAETRRAAIALLYLANAKKDHPRVRGENRLRRNWLG